MGSTAKLVAPMQKRQPVGDGLQIEYPVECRVATTHDQDVLAAEVLDAPYRVEDGLALVGFDACQGRPLRREGAAAGGNHHYLSHELGAGVGDEPEAALARPLEGIDAMAQMKRGPERLDLSH